MANIFINFWVLMKIFLRFFCCFMAFGVAFADSSVDYFREGSVWKAGDSVVIQGTIISKSTVDKVSEILDSDKGVKKIWLSDIPGGLDIQKARLAWLVEGLDVYVSGACYSACALVALAGKTLTLTPSVTSRSTLLILHGTFDAMTGRWSNYGVRFADMLIARLPGISPEVIGRALESKNSSGGLYIFSEAVALDGEPSSNTFLCQEYLIRCSAVQFEGGFPLNRIKLSDLKLPKD